jgi:hypothetical protein
MRERIKAMLKEYVASGDSHEVERQLTSLNAPFVHHEVVKQALMMATDDMKSCSVRPPKLTVLLRFRSSLPKEPRSRWMRD